MKIGLIGYHNAPNYGTMLQAYALAYVLSKRGHECEYIQYRCTGKRSRLEQYLRNVIRWCIQALNLYRPKGEFGFFYSKEFKIIMQRFNNFHKNFIPCSKKCYYRDTIEDVNELYERFMVGSDQTWSPYMNTHGDGFTFLDFVNDDWKKLTYAPSVGTLDIKGDYKSYLADHLHNFAALSCREYENAQLIAQLAGKQVDWVLDPTLLLSKKEWDDVSKPIDMPDRYVLCYALGEKDCIVNYAEFEGKKRKCPVYYIATRPKYLSLPNVLTNVGPREWIYLISHADCVVTDSFHGTLFSVNYNVDFISFAKRKKQASQESDNDRILSFLKILGLEKRFKEDNDTTLEGRINYMEANSLLERYRGISNAYLDKTLI